MIPEEKIQEVIDKADIVSVISKYTKVEKRGKEYISLCLFHNDSSPSMNISPEKKIFKCFSCGVGGNVIAFIQKYKNVSFVEAVVSLAEEYNVDLGDFKVKKAKDPYSEKQKQIFEINNEAMKYFQTLLFSNIGHEAKEYLSNRNINKDDIYKWGIGYATSEGLSKYLKNKGYKEKEIEEAALSTIKDDGIYDYFKNRIVFPIKNVDGFITGFSGRVLTDEKPKYLNTRETVAFKKSEIVYNIDQVSKNKERYEYIIVLEGFMDVISLDKAGISNSVALMGTNLSNFHLNTLKNLKKPIKLFLDGDEPGVNAMFKNSPKLIESGIKFTIVDNETINDPDELIESGKIDELNNMITNSLNPYEYFIKKWNKDNLSIDDKNEIINKILTLLSHEENLLTIDNVINLLSEKFNISIETLKETFKKYDTKKSKKEPIKKVDLVDDFGYLEIIDENNQKYIPIDSVDDPMPLDELYEPMDYSIEEAVSLPIKAKTEENYYKFDNMMQSKIFMSIVKNKQYINEIEDNLTYIYRDFVWQKIVKAIIGYYRTDEYMGDNVEQLSELFKNDPNVELKPLGDILKDVLHVESHKPLNSQPLTEKEFEDIVITSRIKAFGEALDIYVSQIDKIDKKINSESRESEREKLKAKRKKIIELHDFLVNNRNEFIKKNRKKD